MQIVLSGLPGVGKTTIARQLAASLEAVHLRIDSIEHALRSADSKVDSEGYLVAYAIAEDNLRIGRTVVADCVNPWPATRSEWSAVAERAVVRAISVEVVCTDVDEHRRRVESRLSDIAGHRSPTWADVIARVPPLGQRPSSRRLRSLERAAKRSVRDLRLTLTPRQAAH